MRLADRTCIGRFWLRLLLIVLATTSVAVAQVPGRIQSLVRAGNLAEMRWPNFRDYKPWLQEVYEPTGFAPAWVQGSMPSHQARAMIDLFAHAWQKGLEPDDYDASRWEERLRSLAGSSADPAGFDVALTVCTMRYISDLRIGRIKPNHLKFDLSVEQKKYDLAQFLR